MIPSPVPKELYGLAQREEMLIARVFPVISVYTNPGRQRAYKGHCINFPKNIQHLADSLPRYPKQLPIIIVVNCTVLLNSMCSLFYILHVFM